MTYNKQKESKNGFFVAKRKQNEEIGQVKIDILLVKSSILLKIA